MGNYDRILLKLSGEALAKDKGFGYDYDFVKTVVKELMDVQSQGKQVSLVVGAGNFWRGRQGADTDRTVADQMGMLATIMNALFLQDAIENAGGKAVVLSSIEVDRVAELYTKKRALDYLSKGYIVIFGGGTGSPYFSTDTAAALRAAEIEADVILLAKNVDGIYSADPKVDASAKKYDVISYADFIKKGLKAMDLTAVTMCMENDIPILCFMLDEVSIVKAASGEDLGTWIK